MTGIEMLTAIVKVAALALFFGAGVPTLYALAMRAHAGNPVRDANGVVIDDTEASHR